jgi:plasmid stability protein
MATLTIRNLDDTVVKQLKERAKDNERSLEAEVRILLAQAAERPSPKKLRELAQKIFAMTPKGVKQTDSTEIIREFRDR